MFSYNSHIAQNRLYLGCIARTLVRDWQRELVINPNVFARRAALFDFVVEYNGRKLHTAGKVCCLRSLCRTHGQSGQTVFGLLLRSMTGCAVAPTATGLVNGKGQNSTPPTEPLTDHKWFRRPTGYDCAKFDANPSTGGFCREMDVRCTDHATMVTIGRNYAVRCGKNVSLFVLTSSV